MKRVQKPLRVALVASSLRLAGAEKQTVYLSRALLELGIEVRFYHLGEDGPYKAALSQIGIPLFHIYRPNQPLFMLARLARALHGFNPQIVFAPQFGDLLQGGTAGRCCNAMVLGGIRSDGFYELCSHGRRSRWMLMLAQGLVANSHRAVQNLVSNGVHRRKLRVLPNVLDLSEFDSRSLLPCSWSLPSNRVKAVAVGSLQPCKRFDRFLRALALARRTVPDLLGVIAGADRGSRRALEQMANELELVPNHIVFVGECDNIPALLKQADCLVLCSDYEGFPNVILEAMAAALPVITTPVGDAARIVRPDRTGYVVDGDEVEALAGRLVQLAVSPETRTRLGREARTIVTREYSYSFLPLRLLSIFHDFAAQNRRSRLTSMLRGWLGGTEVGPLSARPLLSAPVV